MTALPSYDIAREMAQVMSLARAGGLPWREITEIIFSQFLPDEIDEHIVRACQMVRFHNDPDQARL